MLRDLLAVCTIVVTTGCSFTAPSAPTVGAWKDSSKSEWVDSPDGALMLRAAPNESRLHSAIRDQTRRCEGRLSALVKRIKWERRGRAAVTAIGGISSAAGGVTSAVLEDDGAKTATAIVAAVGGLVALTSAAIGDPSVDLDFYAKGIGHYNKAIKLAADSEQREYCKTDEEQCAYCAAEILDELLKCNDDPDTIGGAGKTSGDTSAVAPGNGSAVAVPVAPPPVAPAVPPPLQPEPPALQP